MTTLTRSLVVVTAALALTAGVSAQQSATTPPAHHPNTSGQVMGFDLDKTTHHFLLYDDGGAIDVSVKDKADKANLDGIRMHLSQIAMMFGHGHFEAPMAVHDGHAIPGMAELVQLKDKVKYAYAETPAGGRVDIVTTDKDAIAAVHAFLKFQIKEHETGDTTKVVKRK